MKKRILSILLVMCIVLALLPSTAFAADDIIASGECGAQGDNLTWTLNSEGVLTISGEGEMVADNYPWDSQRREIKSIILLNGVTSIGSAAFTGCTLLTSVDIQGSNMYIGTSAFWGCSSLPSIYLPASTFVGAGAFAACVSLEEISIDSNHPSYVSDDGIIYDKQSNALVLYPSGRPETSYVVKNGTTSIRDYAFYGAQNLDSVVIPDGVTSIGMRAFCECRSLKQVNIPDGVTTIANEAFMNSGLTSIELPTGLSTVGLNAFMGCSNLAQVILPEDIQVINNYMFASCSSLEEINIPDSVTLISSSAFFGCKSLRNVVIPESVTRIAAYAFGNCTNISEIIIPDSVATMGVEVFVHCGLTNAVISKNLTEIPRNTFDGCGELATVVIPSSVITIGDAAFDVTQNGTAIGSKLSDVYYSGNQQQWDQITIGNRNAALTSANIHFIHFVSYYANGGTGRVADDLIEDGNSFTLPSCEFTGPDGRAFKAWSIGGREYAPGDTCIVTADITITAIWQEKGDSSVPPIVSEKYIVSYNPNGGMGTMNSVIVEENMPFTLPACGFTAPAGKEFKAWQINGQEYAPGSAYTVTDDITITAIWKDIDVPLTPPEVPNKYTVSYDANGGTGTMDDVQVNAGETFVFPACGFTAPAEKKFKAWQIGNTEYNPNDVYTVTADTTVTAVWQDATTIPTQPVSPSDPVTGCILTGTITGHKGVTYTSVTAQLVGLNGSTYFAKVGTGVVDKTGKTEYTYTVSAPAGQYNLNVVAITDAGGVVTRTVVVKLTGNGQTKDINLPNGQAKATVNNNTDTAVIVGGLDELIIDTEGEVTGEVTLTIKGVDDSDPAVAAIRNAAPGRTLEFMDISISKTVDGTEIAVTDTGDVTIEVVLAFDRREKDDIAVYRYHGGSVETLTTQESKNGEKIEIDEESLAIYAKKFSVYAIGYTVSPADPIIPSNPTTPSYSSGNSGSDPTYSINIPSRVTGGTVKVTPTSACAASKITITAKPNSGYNVGSVTVTDKNGKKITVSDVGDGKYTFTMPNSKVDVKVEFVHQQTTSRFTDVQPSAYYADAVTWAVEKGITVGTSATTFSPDEPCTRAQIVTFLWRAAGSPVVGGNNSFTDVAPSNYYYDAVQWAVAQGITVGTSVSTFSPDATCTRGQTVTFLYRYEKSPTVSGSSAFMDIDADVYYADAVQWAVNKGVTAGTSAITFSPNAICTRGQIVTFLYRDMA